MHVVGAVKHAHVHAAGFHLLIRDDLSTPGLSIAFLPQATHITHVRARPLAKASPAAPP
jgi:hypothetical protein